MCTSLEPCVTGVHSRLEGGRRGTGEESTGGDRGGSRVEHIEKSEGRGCHVGRGIDRDTWEEPVPSGWLGK